MMQRRTLTAMLAVTAALWATAAPAALAQNGVEAPDALVKRLSVDILETIKADPELRSGNIARISQVVDTTVMPHVNFRRMTSAAVGPQWRQASPEQRERLQQEFKLMLIRTYAGALKQVSDQRVVVKPLRAAADDKDVLVRTEVHGKGEPVQLDFRLENADGKAWKIYNLNVLGVWMVETYRTQFAQELNKGGIDGLINALSSRTMAADTSSGK
ncbi:MAG TPA: ABC transporter substrate-binding protein [Comamonas sp.]|uniref:MlaC/ttg2D family ABC transporter substrate-binding protein n=1 Tax=Comamonas halotolerans TaxID=3041496 RepID=UPI0024E0DB57|nr:ABC transporter substrate-binding protein [Comamonas sp. NoAH]